MKQYVQIITNTNTEENAEKIANALVRNRLAACVQIIGPTASVYWWKGEVEGAKEWLCIVKTRKDLFNAVEALVRRYHTYETPEILAVPIIEGNESYISWLNKELRT